MNPVIPDEAKEAQSVVEGLLGDSVLGIYLFGSAVVGGLKRDSDVDLLVVVNHSLTFLQRKSLVTQLMDVSGAIGNPHSIRPLELTVVKASDVVPWQFPPRAAFVYGEWLREAFEAGIVPQPARDPDLAIVLKQVIDNSLPLHGCEASSLLEPVPLTDIRMAIRDSLPNLLADTAGDERNVVLTLSRMWLTVATGDIAPKDVAARWAEKQAPPAHAALLEYAREGYLGRVEDAWQDKHEDFELLVSYLKRAIEVCLDADFAEKPGRDVQGEYTAEDCESMATLTLTRDQAFTITFSDSEPLTGNWAVESMPYIHLFSREPRLNYYYQVEFEQKKDFSWEVDIVRLHPLGNHMQIQDCVFVKGVRVD